MEFQFFIVKSIFDRWNIIKLKVFVSLCCIVIFTIIYLIYLTLSHNSMEPLKISASDQHSTIQTIPNLTMLYTNVYTINRRVIPILYCVCVTIFSISHQSNSNNIHYLNEKKKLTQHFKLKIIVKMDDSKELNIFSLFFLVCLFLRIIINIYF